MADTGKYVQTENVIVFPSTRRASTQPSARLTSEMMLTSIINHLIDMDGFVVSDTFVGSSPLEFNIHGYYFKVSPASSIISSTEATSGVIYANIFIDNGNEYKELISYDDSDSYYKGLEFTVNAPAKLAATDTGKSVYSLKILQYDSAAKVWTIPESSKYKYNSDSLELTNIIDGGEI